MIRDITVGQYYASDSAIHRLDPRVKILGTMAFVVMLFIINDIYSYAFSILALALVIAISKVPSSFIFRGIKSILFIIFLTAILNVITTKGTHILLQVVHGVLPAASAVACQIIGGALHLFLCEYLGNLMGAVPLHRKPEDPPGNGSIYSGFLPSSVARRPDRTRYARA